MKITVQTKYGTYTHEYEDGDDDTIWELNRKWASILAAMGYPESLIEDVFDTDFNDVA